MRLRCRVLFTTRSSFENSAVLNLAELSEENALFLFSAFFTRAEMERETVTEIIRTIHSHTLAIELAARLLQRSFIKPSELLEKLKSGFGTPDTSDKIRFTKDGTAFSDTYHNHIRTLFALGNLCDEDKYVMRCLSFVPERGIDARNFAIMAQLSTMNSINDLAEYGFIRTFEPGDYTISLHPMIRDITVTDLQPTFTNCNRLMNSVKKICGFHGKLVPNFQLFADILDGIMTYIYADSPEFIPFAEDASHTFFSTALRLSAKKFLQGLRFATVFPITTKPCFVTSERRFCGFTKRTTVRHLSRKSRRCRFAPTLTARFTSIFATILAVCIWKTATFTTPRNT